MLGKRLTESLLLLAPTFVSLYIRSDVHVPPSKRQDTIGSSAR